MVPHKVLNLMKIFDAWLRWSLAARWTSGVAAVWVVSSLVPALHERHIAASFGANFVALGLHYGLMVGSIAVSILLAPKISSATGKEWLPWVVGFLLFVLAAVVEAPLGKALGVSKQLDGINDSGCYTDWDGRSNPSVCE